MVTVKKEVPVESAFPTITQQYDFDHYGATPPPPAHLPIPRSQVPWWHPQSKPAPGPQEDYESEFQVLPPTWPSFPTAQVKSPNRTVPTTLDLYEMQLRLLEEQNKKSKVMAKQEGESMGSAWTFPERCGEFINMDYQMQLRCLEERNKRSDGMGDEQWDSIGPVSGTVWTPPPGWKDSLSPDHLSALKYLTAQAQTRLTMSSNYPRPIVSPVNGAYAAKGDCQMKLMLLEQQNKKHLMVARQQQDSMPSPHPPTPELGTVNREQSVDSVWSAQFTPESTPGLRQQSVDSVWSNQFTPESTPDIQEPDSIQLKFEQEPDQIALFSNNISIPWSYDCHSSCQTLQDHNRQLAILEQQNRANVAKKAQQEEHSVLAPDRNLQCYQQEFMAKEQLERKGFNIENQFKEMTTASTQPSNHALQDYQMQMMLLEQHHKRLTMKRQKQGFPTPPMQQPNGSHARQDYEMQLMLLERQNKRRLMTERQKQGLPTPPMQPPNGNHALQDYEMQLMLLEQQNKKRLMMARQEQEAIASRSAKPTTEQDLDAGQKNNGPSCVAGGSRSEIFHSKPLVIRGRPTCDD